MAETVPSKKNGCNKFGAREIENAPHITCVSVCNHRYGSASKTKILIGVVFNISSDRLPSGHLRMNVHAKFDLGRDILNISKVNLRSCKLAP